MAIQPRPIQGRAWILILSFLFILCADLIYAQSCSAENPCETGCCNKSGTCGFGPEYCRPDRCVADCDRMAECDPGGFTLEYALRSSCPLNACCSNQGTCGTGREYCGEGDIVRHKNCGAGHTLRRVVGYYEGWAPERDCKAILPEQIMPGVYTHINVAYATIDTRKFEVRPAYGDVPLYERLLSLRLKDPDLKIYISIATHGFNGVDLDWQYPIDMEQGGRDDNFENFPGFIANLKKALRLTAGNDGLSLKLPASYNYLKNFDIEKFAQNVDFFNLMTYDLHGTWNTTDKWSGPYLNAHTNLTEIEKTMDLLWRNKINPDQVVLGMSFHGRAFTATTPDCLEPGCTYESGAPRQTCSNELGLIMNSEIIDLVGKNGTKSYLDKEAAVKIMTFDKVQWVSYDDEESIQLKVDYVKKQCLSGIMVWAISQDTAEGRFSSAIGSAVGTDFKPPVKLNKRRDSGLVPVTTKHPQCLWTNCNQNCPDGWIRMMREDPWACDGEFFTDATGCKYEDGFGMHQWCCPPGSDLPKCGWFTHNNGACDPTCPEGTVEVGSNNQYCHGKYQAACCTIDTDSMVLYSQCSWADAPICDIGSCGDDTTVALSPTGSGGVTCAFRSHDGDGPNGFTFQERKYCCDQRESMEWAYCEWYDDIGLAAEDDDDGLCLSGCLADRVRVALDGYWNNGDSFVCTKGMRSRCCVPKYETYSEEEPPGDLLFRVALNEWVSNPSCPAPDGSTARKARRSDDGPNPVGSDGPESLRKRVVLGDKLAKAETVFLLALLIGDRASQNQINIWDDTVVPAYPNLGWSSFGPWLNRQYHIENTFQVEPMATVISCNLAQYNSLVVSGKDEILCPCRSTLCCPGNGLDCGHEVDFRRFLATGLLETIHEKADDEVLEERARNKPRPGRPRPYAYTYPNGGFGIIESLAYRTADRWPALSHIWRQVFRYPQVGWCLDTEPWSGEGRRRETPSLNTEHIIELGTIANFFEHAMTGILPSGNTMTHGPINEGFFRAGIHTPMQNPNLPPMIGGEQSNIPAHRIMNALGSTSNDGNLVLAQGGLNLLKSRVWQFWKESNQNPVGSETMNDFLDSPDGHFDFLRTIREAITVVRYVQREPIWGTLRMINNDIRAELRIAQEWVGAVERIELDVVGSWDEYFRDHLAEMVTRLRAWVTSWTQTARLQYGGDGEEELPPNIAQFLLDLQNLQAQADNLQLDLDDLPEGNQGGE